ncbi:MAG: chorismate mutase [Pseudohongiellaceae bacterium]
MENDTLPKELLQAREKIDHIDQQLINLLGERFAETYQVGKIKARQELESFDPAREAQKIEKLRRLSEDAGLNPDLVANLFSQIMQEVVSNHKKLKAQASS